MNNIILKALALGTLVASPFGAASAVVITNSGDYDGSHYEYYAAGMNQGDAALLASGLGGYLATVTSEAENDFINGLIGGAIVWLDGSDGSAEGTWVWTSGPETGTEFWNGGLGGSSPTWANWHGGEPNDWGSGEDYLAMNHPTWSDGTWNDADAGQSYGVVVEYRGEVVPEPAMLGLFGFGLLGIGAAMRRRRS